MDRAWNDSGSERSISDSDHTPGNSNSDSESEEWSGDSAETSESSDTESGNESEESDMLCSIFAAVLNVFDCLRDFCPVFVENVENMEIFPRL